MGVPPGNVKVNSQKFFSYLSPLENIWGVRATKCCILIKLCGLLRKAPHAIA